MNIFRDKKTHINIATIGHFNHGKTTLSAAIAMTLANKKNRLDKKSINVTLEEKNQGIGIYTHHFHYETTLRHYSHTDCPGHTDYINNMIAGLSQVDSTILVISAVDGSMAQTKEHLLIAKLLGVSSFIVFINKEDQLDDDKFVYLVQKEISQFLMFHGFQTNKIPIVSGSALLALETLIQQPNVLRGENYWVDKIYTLIELLDSYIPKPKRKKDKHFLMWIDSVKLLPNIGPIAMGRIEQGTIKVGEFIDIVGFRETRTAKIISLKFFNQSCMQVIAGDDIGVSIEGTKNHNDIKKGMIISTPGTIKSWLEFEAQVYILKREEGGRTSPFFKGYCPQFFFKTTCVTGRIQTIEYTTGSKTWMIMPGDKLKILVKLIYPIGIKKRMRFLIREGGVLVGVGVISNLIK